MSVEKYSALNWSLIPVGQDKKPVVSWKQYQKTRADETLVRAWLAEGYGLGLVTGQISGVVVIDDDRKKHNLNEWGFTSPIVCKTQSGGKHYYFKYREGLKNIANHEIFVDVRGDGGYVIVPPTPGYEWEDFITFAELPEITEDMEKLLYRHDVRGEKVETAALLNLEVGSRNDSLLRLANSLCNKFPPDEWETTVLTLLLGANATYSPPLSDQEVLTIFTQATTFVKSNPKSTDAALKPLKLTQISKDRIIEKQLEQSAPSTGFQGLDVLIKGFVPGHVYTITGQTNVGKTACVANFSYAVARQDRRVLYIALEPDRSIIDYFASIHTEKSFDQLTNDDLKIDLGEIYFYGKEHVRTLDSLVKTLEAEDRYDLVVIDHIGYFIQGQTSTTQEQSNAMKKLASIAKMQQCAILLIQHPKKQGNTRATPLNEFQISGSAAFIQDATDVLIIQRSCIEDESTGSFEYTQDGWINVLKAKSGRNGHCKIQFHDGKALITERGEYEF